MSEQTDEICRLIDRSSAEERLLILNYLRQRVVLHPLEQQWGTTAESILTAIARSSDLIQRGVRGILAEEAFEETMLPGLASSGWETIAISGNQTYDFLIAKREIQIRIQVKLQRREAGIPKELPARSRATMNYPSGTIYLVEVQKTRGGEKKGEKTRPYRFGDFDILAVSLHPSTGDWKRFMYTVGNWLRPRPEEPELIKIFQPVPSRPDDYWTDDLARCIDWFLGGMSRRLYS